MESEGEGQVLASPLFSLADSNTLMLICTGYSKVIYILITGYLNIVILITGVLFVCVFVLRARLFSGLCLRRKKWAAVRSSEQNRTQRVEIKMRNDAQERETTVAWGPVRVKLGRSTKKGEYLAL